MRQHVCIQTSLNILAFATRVAFVSTGSLNILLEFLSAITPGYLYIQTVVWRVGYRAQ